MKNWKTTSLGIVTTIGSICAVLQGLLTTGEVSVAAVMAILTGIGLIVAKDASSK